MLKFFAQRAGFARIFGGSVLSQGLLSATNLLAGLILVRRAPQAQYGYYVLIMSAVPLLAQLQSSFFNPRSRSQGSTRDGTSSAGCFASSACSCWWWRLRACWYAASLGAPVR